MSQTTIGTNFNKVKERITQAALRAGRNPQDIQLVAVSKTMSAETVRQAIQAGATILGENYVQEARKKIEEIGHIPRWDFIGHLQSNKAKYVVDLFDIIHSVDRLSLAKEINKLAAKQGKTMRIFVQVNISGEEAKSGIEPEEVNTLVQEIVSLPSLSVEGLMTMPPLFDDPEKARPYFIALRKLRDTLGSDLCEHTDLKELSMGMSADFEVAIEEGSTLVRVGTAIFGERTYT
jgi:pyridoxal phosphate enzyme (YggS family)